MFRLASILYSLISTSVAGSLIIAALVAGYDTLTPIVIAAAIGFVVSLPISWFVAKALYGPAKPA
jgi:predicted PurR-regulated permease PerM